MTHSNDSKRAKKGMKRGSTGTGNEKTTQFHDLLAYHPTIIRSFQQSALTVIHGPAGTGKTFLPAQYAVWALQQHKTVILCRPSITVENENFGFLPGSMQDKMAPWTQPFFDIFEKHYTQQALNHLIRDKRISVVPLAFMRGRTFDNAFIIADEFQNASPEQVYLLLSRVGQNSTMSISGDLKQSDYTTSTRKPNGLWVLLEKLKRNATETDAYIQVFEFTQNDVKRSKFAAFVQCLWGDQ